MSDFDDFKTRLDLARIGVIAKNLDDNALAEHFPLSI